MKGAIVLNLIFFVILLESTLAEQLTCEFVRHSDGYNCEVKTTFEVQKEVTAVTGSHLYGKGNSDVEVLFLNDLNKSKFMPTKVCTVFPNIYKIDIYGSALVELNKDLFEGCTNLTKIVLKYVKLKTLKEDLFTNIVNLTHLVISFSEMETLPAKLFQSNQNTLQTVDMSFNKLKTINVEFPDSLSMLSLMNNECIDNYYDRRSTTRNITLAELVQEVKTKCGTENEGKAMAITYQEEELRQLKESIDKNVLAIKALETSLQGADMQLGAKIAEQNTEFRAMKTDIATNNQDSVAAMKKFKEEMSTKFEDFFNITSMLNDESRQMRLKLEYNAELKTKSDELEAGVSRNESLIVTVFVLQLVLIAFIVFVVVYVKFFSTGRGRIGASLLSGVQEGGAF